MNRTACAFFDFDGTLIKGDSIVRYVRAAWKERLMPFHKLLKTFVYTGLGLSHVVTDERAKTVALEFWAALPAEKREQFDRAFAAELVKTVYAQGMEEIRKNQSAGLAIVLVSASTENYMKYVADALHADALLCTRVDAEGHVTDNCKGKEKLRRIEDWLRESGRTCDQEASRSYGDTGSDYDMLTAYGQGTCVNPKRALRKKARGELPAVQWGKT